MGFLRVNLGSVLVLWMEYLVLTPISLAVTLTVWEQEKEEDQKVLDQVHALYQKQEPTVLIKRSHFKTEDLRTQFQTSAMGGGGADLIFAPNDFAGPFSVMGVIKPVNAFVKGERFFADVLQTVTDLNNKVWGIPVSRGNHLMLYVNKAKIADAPQTFEELIDLAKKYSDPKKSIYGLAYNLNEPFWLVPFLGAFGEQPLQRNQPRLDTPAMVDALSFVHDLKFKQKIVPSDCDYACAETLFVEQKAAMIINGDWTLAKYADALKDNLIVAALPKLKATGRFMSPMSSGKVLFFNKSLRGSKFDEAKKYAEFLVSKDIQEYFIKNSRRLPALKSLSGSELIKRDPLLLSSMKAMEHSVPMPMAVELRAVWDAIRPQLQRVMSGKAEPKMAAAIMQKDAETKIKEMSQ